MKQNVSLFFLILFLFFCTSPVFSQESSDATIRVAEISIATSIESRNPIGVGTSFLSGVRRLFCYTKITGVKTPTKILHVWYYKEKKMAEIDLSVYVGDYRTFSSKNILPFWKGEWTVNVLTKDRKKLASTTFIIQNE